MFYLSETQESKLNEWKKILPPEPQSASGGAFTFSFTPTSLGIVTKVRYWNGEELDLTNYDEW